MPAPTIVKRNTKGSALTFAEFDTNLQNLADAAGAAGDTATAAQTAAATAAAAAAAASTAAASKASQASLDTLAGTVAGLSSGSALPITTTYSTAIPFDAYRTMGQQTVSAPIAFTKNLTGSVSGSECTLALVADGVNTPTFVGFTLFGAQGYDNTAGRINLISFFRQDGYYYYGVGLGPLADVTAPLESTATVANGAASTIAVLFDEDLDKALAPPDASAFAVSAGHALTASAWGTGNRTVNLTTSTAFVNGEAARTLSYTKNGTRNLRDAAGNEVANFAGKAITNNVAAVDATAPTLVSAIVSNSTPSQVDLVFSEALNATWSASTAFTVSGHTVSGITRTGATTGYLTLTAPFVNGEAARTLGYTQPGSNKMQDLAGNLLANIASAAITNNVAPTSAVSFTDAFVATDNTLLTAHTGIDSNSAAVSWAAAPGNGGAPIIHPSGSLVSPRILNDAYTLHNASWVPSSADYKVSADIVFGGLTYENTGLLARSSSSAQTRIEVVVDNGSSSANAVYGIYDVVAGTKTLLVAAAALPQTPGVTMRVTLEMVGTALSLYIQRPSDNYYLDNTGAFVVGKTAKVTATTAVTAAGFAGVATRDTSLAGTPSVIKNFAATV